MSFLSLQYGQCGNQIGSHLYSTIYEDLIDKTSKPYLSNAFNKWFNIKSNNRLEARAILVDTEQKVVHSRNSLTYDFNNMIAGPYGGSANNWAYGYNIQSESILDLILNKVRKELEIADTTVTFMNILSSSGGTGSGVGCRVIEELKSTYSNNIIINVLVLPYAEGEIITQSYNSILSLSKLHELSDTTIIFENNKLHELCSARTCNNINFSNLNELIAFQLTSVFQPITNICSDFFINNLTSHRFFKYVQLKSSYSARGHNKYESSSPYKFLLNSLVKPLNYDLKIQRNCSFKLKKKNIALAVLTRGGEVPNCGDLSFLKFPSNFVKWMPPMDRFLHCHEERKICGNERSATMISNDNRICFAVNTLIEDAWNLFSRKAYLHHYQKYNVCEEEFIESFQIMENILSEYMNI